MSVAERQARQRMRRRHNNVADITLIAETPHFGVKAHCSQSRIVRRAVFRSALKLLVAELKMPKAMISAPPYKLFWR